MKQKADDCCPVCKFLMFFILITAFSRLIIQAYSRCINKAFTTFLGNSGAEDAQIVIKLFLKNIYF